jgi:hypothetical protein
MKSIDRCTATHQGDRCKARLGHLTHGNEPGVPEELKLFHYSNFTVWDDTGVKGKALGAEIRPHHRRNRRITRAFHVLTESAEMPGRRQDVLNDLTKLEKFYSGQPQQ